MFMLGSNFYGPQQKLYNYRITKSLNRILPKIICPYYMSKIDQICFDYNCFGLRVEDIQQLTNNVTSLSATLKYILLLLLLYRSKKGSIERGLPLFSGFIDDIMYYILYMKFDRYNNIIVASYRVRGVQPQIIACAASFSRKTFVYCVLYNPTDLT